MASNSLEIFPCFERQTVADLLDARGVSWRYYGVGPDTGWIRTQRHLDRAEFDQAHLRRVNQKCTGTEWTSHIEFTPSAILYDISTNCKLRGVSWVIPDAFDSDHMARQKPGGPSWVASIVNAVGNSTCPNPDGSSYWDSTAIIVTWDDWGGWYDHEPPLIEAYPQGGYQMGFRVPLIVVSAYTPAGYIHNERGLR